MTIRNRLKLIGLVPITLLILLSGYFFVTSYLNYEKVRTLRTILKNNVLISGALTNTGSERGITAIYLGSGKKDVLKTLRKQYANTDKSYQKLRTKLSLESNTITHTLIALLSKESNLDTKQYKIMLDKLSKINQIRILAQKPHADFKNIFFEQYTQRLTNPMLENLMQTNRFALNTEIASLVNTLSLLYISKENTGLERGFVSYFMSKKSSMSFEEIALWDQFKTKANIFDPAHIQDPKLRSDLLKLMSNPKAKKLLTELQETSSAIQTDVDNGDYAEDVMDWFSLQTQKIALMSKAEQYVSNALWEKTNSFLQKQLLLLAIAAAIWLLSFILAYLGYTTTKDITSNIKELGDVLNKAVNEMRGSEQYLSADAMAIENINLDTHEGTKEAYKFLEQLVETAKEDKLTALQANEAKSLFLANMSHEIRTPLNGIVGFTEILRSTELTAEQEEFLNIIDKSSENLLSIINNILDLSKIESNKIEIENIVFDSMAEFESAIETYAVAAAEKNIDLNFYMDPTISPKLKGDPTKIKEILINLLSNAIKFTSYGGEINVEIKKVDEGVNFTPRIYFSVQDNGIGMTKEQQSRIFEAFSQADVSVTRKYGGTGLGLTISSQFVELMGGKLELESAKDKGTTFYFSLPLEEITATEPSYMNVYSDLIVGKYEQEIPTKLDNYLDDYFKYFGPSVKHFETVGELKELIDNDLCKNYWVDIDKAKQNILDAIDNLDKSKLVVIANVTSRAKIEDLGINQDNVIFKPLTLSKMKGMLQFSSSDAPKLEENSVAMKARKFDAKVLVTEDNVINQKLIQRVLEDHGIHVDIANNGLESFEKRKNGNYDLIFMDIQMPVMDGIEATHEILDYEEDEELPHIPIIALTANALKGDRERFLAEGMDEYITKPIQTEELLYVLNKFLGDKATTEDLSPRQPLPKQEEQPVENTEKTSHEHTTGTIDIPSVSTSELDEGISLAPSDTITLEEQIDNSSEMIQQPFRKESSGEQKILIAKKFLLERRLLVKVLNNLGYECDAVEDMHEVNSLLSTGQYDIVFADEDISIIAKNVAIITGHNDKNEIENIIQKYRG